MRKREPDMDSPFLIASENLSFNVSRFVSHRNVLHIGCGVFGVAGEG